MAYLRFNIDLAFKQPMSLSLQTDIDAFKTVLLKIKPFAERINASQMNAEDTRRAKSHICKHDEGLPCESEIDVKSNVAK